MLSRLLDWKRRSDINQVLERINRLDLEPIAFSLVYERPGSPPRMTRKEAYCRVALYRKFLRLVALYPNESIVPTLEIDEVWHLHILDTAKYLADCMNVFGRMIHHFPYLGMRGADDREEWQRRAARTQELFYEVFGEVMVPETSVRCTETGKCDSHGGCDTRVSLGRARPRLSDTGELRAT